MSRNELYELAMTMLKETNVYNRSLDEFHYNDNGNNQSLIEMVSREINRYTTPAINNTTNKYKAYDAIKNALMEYLDYYSCSFSFRQKTKEKFGLWLKSIRDNYKIEDDDLSYFEISPNDQDAVIVMLKALHSREGVTKKELAQKLNLKISDFHNKTIQTNLRKLCRELYRGSDEEYKKRYNPLKIGGQTIKVDIQINDVEAHNEPRYRTLDTLHPIVLQENYLQVQTLIEILSNYYNEEESEIAFTIAIDIWCQLSDYAKDKIKNHFMHSKYNRNFINLLEDGCPNDYACSYSTEREMINNKNMSTNDKISFLTKGPGVERRCNVVYKNRNNKIKKLNNQRVDIVFKNGKELCCFISKSLKNTLIDKNNIDEITIL